MLYTESFCRTIKWISHMNTPSILNPLHPPCPYPTPLGHHRALNWAPCTIQQLPTTYLFTHGGTCIRRRQWHLTPALLPGKSHGWRSLAGCSPWDRKESNTTEWLHFHFSLSCIGEGNGSPLQCSCLENPRDGEAWWAAVYGVTQCQTRLKWLSSSSSSTYISVLLSQFIPPSPSPCLILLFIQDFLVSPLQCKCYLVQNKTKQKT